MTIKEAQELIETWTAKNNVRNNELTNMALLTEDPRDGAPFQRSRQ